MALRFLRDWFGGLAARQRLQRLRYEWASRLLEAQAVPVAAEPDAAAWTLLGGGGKSEGSEDAGQLRTQVRQLADTNPYARNALLLYRNYVLGSGMKQEVVVRAGGQQVRSLREQLSPTRHAAIAALWREFLDANDWDAGNRKDWEFCLRTWRDGECFMRLFRQPAWPPRIHFVDPERVAPHPRTGLPTHGIATVAANVEEPVRYLLIDAVGGIEWVAAEQMLHTKIGVDGNVKRGLSIFLPVLEALRRFQGWLDVELIQRKVASSIVLVRKHHQNFSGDAQDFAVPTADGLDSLGGARRLTLQPGSIVDAQGFDLQFLAPNTHFADASLLGRTLLLAVAAGLGLPEYMLVADASNANYASTLVAEGPAVRQFAAWQSFFIGQWRKLFRMVLREAERLGLLEPGEAAKVELHVTPPPLAVRDRLADARADALYFDRGVLSRRELARREQADPEQMERERDHDLTLPTHSQRDLEGGTP